MNQSVSSSGLTLRDNGIRHLQEGDFESAVRSLQAAIKLLPQDAETHYQLALALECADRPSEARPVLARVLVLDPAHEGAKRMIGSLPNSVPPGLEGAVTWDSPESRGQPGAAPPLPNFQPGPAVSPSSAGASGLGAAFVPGPLFGDAVQPPPPGATVAEPIVLGKHIPPTLPQRLVRGVKWGALLGLLWIIPALIGWEAIGLPEKNSSRIQDLIVLIVVCSLAGIVTGLIVALFNQYADTGWHAGVTIGAIGFASQVAVGGRGVGLISVIAWLYLGWVIGGALGGRSSETILVEPGPEAAASPSSADGTAETAGPGTS